MRRSRSRGKSLVNSSLSGSSLSRSRSHEEPLKCTLKIKSNNRVKKVAQVPNKFKKLDELIRKKYDEFKAGKETYQICYIDDEEEQIDISDEEDYGMFLSHLKDNKIATAKVFLNRRGTEFLFDRYIDDAQTVHESVLGDTIFDSVAGPRQMFVNKDIQNSVTLDEIKLRLAELENHKVLKEKEKKKKLKKEEKEEKAKKNEEKKKKKVENKAEKAAKKVAKKEAKKMSKKEVKPEEEKPIDAVIIIEEKEVPEEKTNVVQNDVVELVVKDDHKDEIPVDVEIVQNELSNEEVKHEFSIQPVLKRVINQKDTDEVL
jgi:hypothetical protein